MTLIPFFARLGPKDQKIDAHATVERIRKHFPDATVDWNRGDEEVYRGIARLREMGGPDDWIEAKRKSLGHVAYVGIRDEQYPGFTGWFFASHIERDLGDCFDLYSEPATDIPFLKHLASEIAFKIDFVYLFSTDSTWGIQMRSEPERWAPFEFARKKYPECNYGPLTVRKIEDWKASLRSAVPRWFEQATFKSKQEMVDRAGSIDAVATSTIEALTEIDDVHAAWLVDISAPFHNSLVIEHNSWMSSVSLGGAPKGILA